jgi:hypothetical protein
MVPRSLDQPCPRACDLIWERNASADCYGRDQMYQASLRQLSDAAETGEPNF